MPRASRLAAFGAAAVILTVGAAPFLANAADHLDSPNAKANHALDITDIYAFDGANSGKTVLAVDVNPFAGVMSGTRFATDAEYRLNVDRTGNAGADDVYTFTFANGGPGGKQLFTLKKNGTTLLNGMTGNANVGGGVKVFAGLRDDPFYFDLNSFLRWRDPDGDGTYTYTGPTTFDGIDTFKGTNISTIVMEIPDSWLGGHAAFWSTTVKNGTVVDRMGKPALNTVFMNPFGGTNQKDPYNQTDPSNDVATWGPQFRAVLGVFNSTGTANAIADLLLPDVLNLDVAHLGKATGTSFTGDTAGHILNGRTPAEDVIDLELPVVTGALDGHPVLTTDGVNANDAVISGSFPYLAAPH